MGDLHLPPGGCPTALRLTGWSLTRNPLHAGKFTLWLRGERFCVAHGPLDFVKRVLDQRLNNAR